MSNISFISAKIQLLHTYVLWNYTHKKTLNNLKSSAPIENSF